MTNWLPNADVYEMVQAFVALLGFGVNSYLLYLAVGDMRVANEAGSSKRLIFLSFSSIRQHIISVLVQLFLLAAGIAGLFMPPPHSGEDISAQAILRNAIMVLVTTLLALQSWTDWWDRRIEERYPWESSL